jgi:hypothetical protein
VCQVAGVKDTLRALNEKYPTCSTCQSRVMRSTKVKGKRVQQAAWCQKHNRLVQYNTTTDDRGKPWVVGDIPCEDYTYEYRPALLFGHPVD